MTRMERDRANPCRWFSKKTGQDVRGLGEQPPRPEGDPRLGGLSGGVCCCCMWAGFEHFCGL